MRRLKKIGTVLVASALVLSFLFVQVPVSQAAKTGPVQKKAYLNFMGKSSSVSVSYLYGYSFTNAQTGAFRSKTKTISQKRFMHYVFQDINGDGVIELIVSNTRNTNESGRKVMICTYVNGKVVPVYCVGGLRNGVFTKGKQICFGFGGSDTETYAFAKLVGTTLKHVATYRKETVRSAGDKVSYRYYKNNKKIKKSQYQKALYGLSKAVEV